MTSGTQRVGAFSLALGALACGCGPGLEFAPWTIEIGEAVPVMEYGPVSERTRARNKIELVEDLVISPRGSDPVENKPL